MNVRIKIEEICTIYIKVEVPFTMTYRL